MDYGGEAIEQKSRWKLLGILYIAYLALIISLQSLPPVLRFVMQDLQLSHANAGLLMSIFALPGLIISIPGGLFLGMWGVRFTVAASLLLMIAGGLMAALVESYELMIIGRLIAGAGGMTMLVIFPQMLAHVFHGKEVGVAMGLLNTAMPVGTIIPFMTMGAIAGTAGWHLPLTLGPLLGIAALAIFLRYISNHDMPRKTFKTQDGEKKSGGIKDLGAPVWLVSIAWMFFNAAVISFLTFSHQYFVHRGYTDARAGFISSMWFWAAIAVIPLIGHISDRYGRREILIAAGCIAMAALIPLVSPLFKQIIVLMMILSVVQSFVPAPVYALVHDLVKPGRLGIAYGIVNTMLNAGIFIGPWLIGMVWDVTSSYNVSFAVMSIFSIVSAVSILVCLRMRKAASAAGYGGQTAHLT